MIRDILRRFALCIDTFVLMNNTHFDGRATEEEKHLANNPSTRVVCARLLKV